MNVIGGNGSKRGVWDGVFLDFYGTIASGDVQAVEAVCQQAIDDYRLASSASEMAVLWGKRFFEAIEATNGAFRTLKQIESDTLIETLAPFTGSVCVKKYIRVFNAYLGRPTLFEEVREVLGGLGAPVCIVSNADDEELYAALEHHGLKVDFVVTSEASRSYKPDRRIFEAALAATGWSPDRVVHVGDSLHSDVGGAHGAGLKAAWVNRAVRISDIGEGTPDFTWTDLRPLVDLTYGRLKCP